MQLPSHRRYFIKFKEGNEKGLEFFYNLLYPSIYYYGLRYIKDDVNADCIVNEAFLRLWLCRENITCPEHIETFVRKITAEGCRAYFKTSSSRFHRNMLRLDEIENYQDFIAGYDPTLEEETAMLDQYEPGEEEKKQWQRVKAVIPNLSLDQQLFIRLCIKYAFDYGSMAWHIGGISDYQVAKKVEQTLKCLKALITDTEKLNQIKKTSRFSFEGDVSDEQASILQMRYELQYSFSEIAAALNLNQGIHPAGFCHRFTKNQENQNQVDMENSTMVVTRKIQLLIDSEDQQVVKQAIKQLYDWQWICFRAANMIMSHHFIQERVKDFFYLTEEIKLKIADEKKEEHGILKSSRQNTTYRLLSNHFKGQIPTNILSNLNNTLISYFNKEKDAYWKGEKSLRNYKRNIPLPFGSEVISKLSRTADNRNFSFRLFQIPFKTYLGKDRLDKKLIFEKIMNGTLKLRASQIQLEKGKLFLLAAIHIEKDRNILDPTIIAEASLSIEHPVTVKIGSFEHAIGNKEEFLHRRLAIQAAVSRVKKAVLFNSSGHGRKKKMRSLEDYRHLEKRYVEQKLHVYSRMLIDHCIKHRAATLLLINQQEKEEIAKEDHYLLQNWSYYSLKEKISYKAARAGIQVIVE